MANNNKSSASKASNTATLNWITKYQYKTRKPKKEYGEKHPDLQIDGTLSIRQMVQRYNQGMTIPVSSYEYFDGETLHPSADLTEKLEFIEKYSKIANSELQERGSGGETSPPDTTSTNEVENVNED